MALTLNGVNLDQRPKWWSFVNEWPNLHGWCAAAYRAELIETVTGVTYAHRPRAMHGHTVEHRGLNQAGVGGDLAGGSAVPVGQRPGHSGSLLMQDFTHRRVPVSGHNYYLVTDTASYSAGWASMRWGMLADGDDRFSFNFTDAAAPTWIAPVLIVSTTSVVSTASSVDLPLTVSASDANRALYVFALNQDDSGANRYSVSYLPEGTNPGSAVAFTKVTELKSPSNTSWISVWRLLSPTPTVSASVVRTSDPQNKIHSTGVYYLSGVDQTTPEVGSATNSGTGSSTSLSLSAGGLSLDAGGWLTADATGIVNPTPGVGQTQAWALSYNNGAGQTDAGFGGSSGAVNPTWSLGASRFWLAAGSTVKG